MKNDLLWLWIALAASAGAALAWAITQALEKKKFNALASKYRRLRDQSTVAQQTAGEEVDRFKAQMKEIQIKAEKKILAERETHAQAVSVLEAEKADLNKQLIEMKSSIADMVREMSSKAAQAGGGGADFESTMPFIKAPPKNAPF